MMIEDPYTLLVAYTSMHRLSVHCAHVYKNLAAFVHVFFFPKVSL
jgi:hypothetical protein